MTFNEINTYGIALQILQATPQPLSEARQKRMQKVLGELGAMGTVTERNKHVVDYLNQYLASYIESLIRDRYSDYSVLRPALIQFYNFVRAKYSRRNCGLNYVALPEIRKELLNPDSRVFTPQQITTMLGVLRTKYPRLFCFAALTYNYVTPLDYIITLRETSFFHTDVPEIMKVEWYSPDKTASEYGDKRKPTRRTTGAKTFLSDIPTELVKFILSTAQEQMSPGQKYLFVPSLATEDVYSDKYSYYLRKILREEDMSLDALRCSRVVHFLNCGWSLAEILRRFPYLNMEYLDAVKTRCWKGPNAILPEPPKIF